MAEQASWQQPEQPPAQLLGAFDGGSRQLDAGAKRFWEGSMGFEQSRMRCPLDGAPHAPYRPLPKQGSADDPGRMIKDSTYFMYKPYESDLTCALNKFAPEVYRWPGQNRTPVPLRELARRPRAKPVHEIPATWWSGLPKIDPGPGVDMIHKRIVADEKVRQDQLRSRYDMNQRSRAALKQRTAERQVLEASAFGTTGARGAH